MTVEISFIGQTQPGKTVPSSFSDPLDNVLGSTGHPQNLACVNNFNWVFSILGWDTPFNNPVGFNSYSFGSTLSGGGGTGLSVGVNLTGANPPYYVTNGIIPTVFLPNTSLRSAYYTATQKFIQFTTNAMSNAVWVVGMMNFEDASGTGAAGNQFNHDSYSLQGDGGLRRDNSGGNFTQLHNGVAVAQGDVWRLALDATNAAHNVLTVSRNGTQNYQVTDSSTGRFTNAFPFIGVITATAAGVIELKNFSCGLGL